MGEKLVQSYVRVDLFESVRQSKARLCVSVVTCKSDGSGFLTVSICSALISKQTLKPCQNLGRCPCISLAGLMRAVSVQVRGPTTFISLPVLLVLRRTAANFRLFSLKCLPTRNSGQSMVE